MTMIMVAPNGARKTQQDHPAIPVTDSEVVMTAIACQAAGADAIHIHTRDSKQGHLLDANRYHALLNTLRAKVDGMALQVTSEAAGVYDAKAQMVLLNMLEAPWVSLSIREIARAADHASVVPFLEALTDKCRVQFILYDLQDFETLIDFRKLGAIRSTRMEVLYVLGRYAVDLTSQPTDLDPFLAFRDDLPSAERPTAEMVCAFGKTQIQCLLHGAQEGLDVRVGFENGWWLLDGRIAPDNAALVADLRSQLSTHQLL